MTISNRMPEGEPTPRDEWSDVEQVISRWETHLKEIEAHRAPEPESAALALHPLDDANDRRSAEDLFWRLPE